MKKSILVIEDDAAILEVTKTLLELEGFEVLCATNGQEGLDLLNSEITLPNLILLDLMMPVKNGFEFRSEQLAISRLASIPLVAVTANGSQIPRNDKLQAKAFLRKPVENDELVDIVRIYCS